MRRHGYAVTTDDFAVAEAERCKLIDEGRIDHECRAAKADIEHVCRRRDGRPIDPGQPCWVEARRQINESGPTLRAAEVAASVAYRATDPPGTSDLCRPATTPGPQYRYIDLADPREA